MCSITLCVVYYGRDPSTNVVLLEDFGAVIGLTIAASCISLTHYTGNPLPDAVGSLLIGTLLGGVASFIIYTNTMSLVGRSGTSLHAFLIQFHPVKVRYNVFLGTRKISTLKARYVIANREGKRQCIKRSQIPRSCTHKHVTMNTVVQIKQCNQSC